MKLIKPRVVYFRNDDQLDGHFEIEPLERGVGTTIGTMVEGYLLNLLPDIRPCAFRFSHSKSTGYFSDFPGIRENAEEIASNLKKLCVLEAPEGDIDLKISVSSQKTYTASDLGGDKVRFSCPELPLFTADKKIDTDFNVRFLRRTGYYFCEDYLKEKDYSQSYFYFDVSFSPVRSINCKVEPARVGRSINFDKLVVDMKVREGLVPADLVRNSIQYLQQFFNSVSELIPEEVSEFAVEKVEADKSNDNLSISINDLELSIRCRNCLKQINIKTLGDLTSRSIDDLMEIKNFGKKSLDELREILNRYGLKFKNE